MPALAPTLTLVRVRQRVTGDCFPVSIQAVDAPKPGRWVVYCLLDPRSHKPFYVGSTCDFLARMRNHCIVYPATSRRRGFGVRSLDERKLQIAESGRCVLAFPRFATDDELKARAIERFYIRSWRQHLLNTQHMYGADEPLPEFDGNDTIYARTA